MLTLRTQAQGEGRLYYRLAIKYAPSFTALSSPIDRGFSIKRVYEPMDNPNDVRVEDGVLVIKGGARIKVHIIIQTHSIRHHVAMVDRLPAGLEILNPELKQSSEYFPSNDTTRLVGELLAVGRGLVVGILSGWRGRWFDHQNLRDDRVEVFTSYLNGGIHEYCYMARATSFGEFVAPPPSVEEMYSPETFGRGIVEHVKIV